MDISSLSLDGFVSIPYPPEMRDAVRVAMKAWQQFCELPTDVKRTFKYSDASAGIGYEMKDGSGIAGDHKENFDLTARSFERSEWDRFPVEARDFITFGGNLVEKMLGTVLGFARAIEVSYNVPGFASEILSGRDKFFVRFIHYFPSGDEGREIATPHVDQSGFTLHLFESDEGLQYFRDEWWPMPVSEGKTVIIPDMQLQLRSCGALTALCHRVVSTKRSARIGRYSAVSFIQLDGPKYDKATHGRLQEKPVGWNYGMSHAEFSKFFTA